MTAALLAECSSLSAAETLPGPYQAEILRVIDGDTVEARVHIWLGLDMVTHIRLRDIDAAELHGRCPGERESAATARDYLIKLLGDAPVTITKIATDKYGGRVDGAIQLSSGQDVSAAMLSSGHALATTRRRIPRC